MPSKKKVTYGPAVKERAKRLLEALLAYVDLELEDIGEISLSHKWKDETTTQPKLEIETKLRVLEFLTAKDKHEGKLTTTQIRQALNEHLKDFLQILEDKRFKTQGEEEWHFSLKLWSRDKKENLRQFEIEWERQRPEKSKQQEETLRETVAGKTPKPENETLNWQEICRQNLAQQKQLTTNPFTNANGMTPQLDGVYVPLAIVERQKPKPQPRNQQEEKEKETEKLIPIAEERFFEDVLRQGQSEISQGRKIAIIGEPGAGKTTRLQKISDWILEQDLGLPIWIDLAELGEQDICQYLEKVWLSRCQGEVTRGDLEAQINRVWLLLDGVDEMTHVQGMQQLAKDLLRSWVQAARVVVTCRVNVWEADKNAFSGFDVFRNLEFNPEQVTEYIRRWFARMGDAATGESLESALAESENSRLKELIQNPLRLWMLCQIWSSRNGILPDTQAKLYASFIKYIYRWKEQFIKTYAKLCGKTLSECQKLLHQGLGELAKAAIDGKSSRFRLSYRLVSQYLGDRSDDTSLLSLALSLGWLNWVGIDIDEPEESVYAFYHATFQEYFAALAVKDWDYFLPRNHVNFPVVGKEYRIFEAQWKQVILLWLGLEDVAHEQKERFINVLVNFEEGCYGDFYKERAYFLAALGISEFKNCSLSDEIVATIIKWGYGYFNLDKQEWQTFPAPMAEESRASLLQTQYSIAVNQLIDLLQNTEDENARWKAADSLGKIATGNPEAIAALSAILSATNDEDIRQRVANILGEIAVGNPKAIAALIAILSATTDRSTRWEVADCLGKIAIGNPEAIAALIAILSATNDEDIRQRVANILGEIAVGNPKAIAALIAILSATTDWSTRWKAADSLGKIATGNPEAIAALSAILSATNDEDIRQRVANILGEIAVGNPKAIAALIAILSATTDRSTRWKVADSLGKIAIGNPEAIAALIAILSATTDWSTRWEVADCLGKIAIGNPEAIAALIRIISATNDEEIRFRATKILGKIDTGNPEVINALIGILSATNDEDIRWKVAESLGKIATGHPEAIAALIAILSATTNHNIRWRVGESLGKISVDNPKAIAALSAILSATNDEDIRQRVANILGEIAVGNAKAIAALIAILSATTDWYTRWRVGDSLGKIAVGNPKAIAALSAILSATNDEDTRRRVANILGKIATGNPEAIAALIGILSATNDENTRIQVADSLAEIATGHPKAIAALIAILSSATTDQDTRWRVAASLGKIDPGNPEAIAALIAILSATNDEDIRRSVADILGKIATGHPKAIAALIAILSATNDKDTRSRVADILGKIAIGNPEAIAALIAILSATNDKDTRSIVVYILGKIATGHPKAIAALIAILSATNDKDTRSIVADILGKIVQNDQMPPVVYALQQFLCNTTYESNFHLYNYSFEIIWNCAQNLPYPTFYQAWHHQLTTPHPEVPETTGVGSTPFTQSLNLADLPNILDARLVETQLIESVQLICIDTSKFIDSDNPALDIYEQFLDQNCPERLNGEPETLPQLKSYWNRLRRHSDKHPILIFYEDPTSPAARGFSPTFLDALTRFDGTICLITDTPHPPLQTFSPHDPDLLQTVVNWLKRLHLDS